MPAPKIVIAPELVFEGRRLYEQTLTPLPEIAAMMGVSRGTLQNRIREWGWIRRRYPTGPVDLLRAVRGAAIAAVTDRMQAPDVAAVAPLSPERRAVIAARIVGIVEQEMDAVARVLATIQPADQAEGERSTRMLASIALTLREAVAILHPDHAIVPDATDDDDAIPRDMDEFRSELAQRIHALIETRAAIENGGGGELSAAGEADGP